MTEERTFTRSQQTRVLFALSFALALLAIDITIVNVALPAIGSAFNAADSELQWVLDAFNVVMAGTVLLGSGLGDRYGRKRLFIIGLALFAVGSIIATTAPSISVLIGARAIMGLSVAMVMPATFSLLAVVFPPERRPFAIGVWTAVGGVALALGPVIGGILLELFSWSAVFLVNVPIALIALVAGLIFLPESKEVAGKRLDYLGAVLSIFALGGLVFAAIEGPAQGWTSPLVVGAFIVGVVALIGFVLWELHTDAPMFEIRVLKIPPVIAGAVGVSITYFVVFTVLFLTPQYLQFVLGFNSLQIGLALIPMGAIFGILSPFNSRMIKAVGTRATLVSGLVLVGVGLLVMAGIGHLGYGLLAIGLVLIGVGWAACLSPATAVILDALPLRLAGSGSSINQVSRQVGGALGVAIVGSIVSVVFRSGIDGIVTLPEGTQVTAQRSLGEAQRIAQTLGEPLSSILSKQAVTSFDQAARTGFLVAAVLTFLAALLAFVAVKRGGVVDDPEGTDDSLARDEEHAEHVKDSGHHFVGVGSKTHS